MVWDIHILILNYRTEDIWFLHFPSFIRQFNLKSIGSHQWWVEPTMYVAIIMINGSLFMNISFWLKLANIHRASSHGGKIIIVIIFHDLYKHSVETLNTHFMITIKAGIQMVWSLAFSCSFNFNWLQIKYIYIYWARKNPLCFEEQIYTESKTSAVSYIILETSLLNILTCTGFSAVTVECLQSSG